MTYQDGYAAGLADFRLSRKNSYIWNLTRNEPGFDYAEGYRRAWLDYSQPDMQPRESYIMRTDEKMAEVLSNVDPFQTCTPCWHEKSFIHFNIRYFGGAK